MRDGCGSLGNIEGDSIVTPWIEMADYATAVSKRWMYITFMGVVEFPATGENTTIVCAAYAGAATRTDMKGNENER